MGIQVDSRQVALFLDYASELLRWNERINLTAVREPAGVVEKHILDSLGCALVLNECLGRGGAGGVRMVDVGSGAGLPGLVLGIYYGPAGWAVTLIEANGKKAVFLRHVVRMLGLDWVEVVQARAEEVAVDGRRRERYDVAVARAVAELPVLAELCLPLVTCGGLFLAMKGAGWQEELGEGGVLRILGGELGRVVRYTLPYSGLERHLVVVRKVAATPEGFPRRSGIAKKRPL